MFWQVLLSLGVATASADGTGDVYRRVVSRALERAQTQIAGELEFDIDHSRWEDPWVITTAHYEVRATRSYLQTATLARDLEFMYGEFERILGKGQTPSSPLKVWIYPTIGDYKTYGNSHGVHSSLYGSFFSEDDPEKPVVTYQNGHPTLLGMWITHSAAHQYLERVFGPQQVLWVDEGLAGYFSLYWDWTYGANQLERMLKESSFVPLRRLLGDSINAYNQDNANDRFIELGMLFQFVLNDWEATANDENGDPGPFQEFLRATVRGQNTQKMEFLQTLREASSILEEDFKNFEFRREQ